MNKNQEQQITMVRRKFLEDLGIDVPDEANRFYTAGFVIVFLAPFIDEFGCSIVFQEQETKSSLSEKQAESLKTAGCYGAGGWTII